MAEATRKRADDLTRAEREVAKAEKAAREAKSKLEETAREVHVTLPGFLERLCHRDAWSDVPAHSRRRATG